MQPMLLWMFERQVLLQCEFVLLAAENIDKGLKKRDVAAFTVVADVFYGIQNLLNASANISKTLWGQGGRFGAVRKPLRDTIGVGENSPLKSVGMRNNFEHFDERLDDWWSDSKEHRFRDTNIGRHSDIHGFDEIDRFRDYDPKTGELSFWGQEFKLHEIVSEVKRILPKLKEDASKPQPK